MRTFTEEQFIEFCKSAKWVTEQDSDINEYEIPCNTGDEENDSKSRATAYCWKTATCDGIQVQYQDECSWDGNQTQRFGDYDIEAQSSRGYDYELTGATLVDEDGDEISNRDVETILSDIAHGGFLGDVNQIDHILLVPDLTTEEIDMDSDMKEFEITNDNGPNIAFKGEQIASASSATEKSTRWTKMKLFKTASGKFVAQTIGVSQWQGEETRYKAAVCETEADVINFLGYSDTAKEIYGEADIDATVKVE